MYGGDIGTLRVVTVKELVVLRGSFYIPLKVSEMAQPFTLSCQPQEIVSNAEGCEKQIFTNLSWNGPPTWTAGVTGPHTTTYANVPFIFNVSLVQLPH